MEKLQHVAIDEFAEASRRLRAALGDDLIHETRSVRGGGVNVQQVGPSSPPELQHGMSQAAVAYANWLKARLLATVLDRANALTSLQHGALRRRLGVRPFLTRQDHRLLGGTTHLHLPGLARRRPDTPLTYLMLCGRGP